MELFVFLIFLGSFQVQGMTFEHEKSGLSGFLTSKDRLIDKSILKVKPCLPTLSAEWWDEFFTTPLGEIIDIGPINVCLTLYPEVENCWEGTTDKIVDIIDKFGPHLESVWSSLQKYKPYLNGSFCNLQASKSYGDYIYPHNWQNYDECEKCKFAKQDLAKYSFSSDMKQIFNKILKNDFCHYFNSTTDFGESECGAYVEDLIPRVYDWFKGHIESKDSACRDHCSGKKTHVRYGVYDPKLNVLRDIRNLVTKIWRKNQ